jgi:hypothetical protein
VPLNLDAVSGGDCLEFNSYHNMASNYMEQRERQIAANKALLESLGLETLKIQGFAPAAVSGPTKPKATSKAKPTAKAKPKKAQKRKREDSEDTEDDGSADGDYKAPRLDEADSSSEDDNPRRSTRRRAAKRINYNEDNLEKMNAKKASKAKQRTRELGEDRDGRVGNRLGTRLHDP